MTDIEIKIGKPYNPRGTDNLDLKEVKVELSAIFPNQSKALEFHAELVALARKFEGTS